ncbi:prolipoprotein diacylglyceryl transferase [Salinispirillum marinum]|uniref:Phosphatidylglycerol--prolipoprotein diacylglyceryl transferase n=2 Tax=Saccharospirillaceae TaxID=255527 RepID=A0ABV8BE38_9GAMM
MPWTHDLNPVLLSFGPISIYWYGLSYVVAFFAGLYLGRWRAQHQTWRGWTPDMVSDMLTYVIIGTLLGGRLGYILFYQFDAWLNDPLMLVRIWQGGMSFHGGFIGVSTALLLFARKYGKSYWQVTDFIAPLVPLGIAAVRMGNFMNGELWGRPSDVAWAMIFPNAPDALARHPSQLYQAAGEGLLLFILLWWFSHSPRPRFAVTGFFLTGYGFFRSVAEFFRQPDGHIGYLLGTDWLTMGILLSQPMLVLGVAFLMMAYQKKINDTQSPTTPKANKKSGKTRT